MDAHNQAQAAEVRPANQICCMKEEATMEHEATPLPVALRNTQITEQESEAIFRRAEDANATEGVLTRTPRRVAQRKREAVA